jgi:hypothetical protein
MRARADVAVGVRMMHIRGPMRLLMRMRREARAEHEEQDRQGAGNREGHRSPLFIKTFHRVVRTLLLAL